VTDYDIVVVGAGPAGSMAARIAALAGLRVAVIERHAFPREKLCGGFVSAKALAALNTTLPDELIERRIAAVAVQSAAKRTTAAARGRAVGDEAEASRSASDAMLGVTVRRANFDAFLLEAARQAGATVYQPAHVRRVLSGARRAAPSVEVVLGHGGSRQNTRLTAQFVIDASGASSLARRRGPLWPLRRLTLGFAFGAILPAGTADPGSVGRNAASGAPDRAAGPKSGSAGSPAADRAGHNEDLGSSDRIGSSAQPAPPARRLGTLLLADHPVRAGFGWAFPLNGAVNIGVGAWTLDRAGLRGVYHRFVEQLVAAGVIAAEADKVRPRAALLPPGGVPYRLAKGRVLYAGDAAGMIDPYGGEGIYGAVISGRLAAEAVVSVLGAAAGRGADAGSAAGAPAGEAPAAGAADGGAGATASETTQPAAGRAGTPELPSWRRCSHRTAAARYRLAVRRELVTEFRLALGRAGVEAARSRRTPTKQRLSLIAARVASVMQSPRAYRDEFRWPGRQR
jgi:flavin-dependent dehydrogenase